MPEGMFKTQREINILNEEYKKIMKDYATPIRIPKNNICFDVERKTPEARSLYKALREMPSPENKVVLSKYELVNEPNEEVRAVLRSWTPWVKTLWK